MASNKIWEIKKAEKICAFDIDGVLNNYPVCWVNWVNKKLDAGYADINDLKEHLSYDQYRKLKREYRESGVKENLVPAEGARRITNALRRRGYKIIVVTARPAQEIPSLFGQTIRWLDKNKIAYDHIEFGQKNKRGKLVEDFPNIKFIVEDNSYLANQMAKWGYKVFLMDSRYNRKLKTEKGVIRIEGLEQILKEVK